MRKELGLKNYVVLFSVIPLSLLILINIGCAPSDKILKQKIIEYRENKTHLLCKVEVNNVWILNKEKRGKEYVVKAEVDTTLHCDHGDKPRKFDYTFYFVKRYGDWLIRDIW